MIIFSDHIDVLQDNLSLTWSFKCFNGALIVTVTESIHLALGCLLLLFPFTLPNIRPFFRELGLRCPTSVINMDLFIDNQNLYTLIKGWFYFLLKHHQGRIWLHLAAGPNYYRGNWLLLSGQSLDPKRLDYLFKSQPFWIQEALFF